MLSKDGMMLMNAVITPLKSTKSGVLLLLMAFSPFRTKSYSENLSINEVIH